MSWLQVRSCISLSSMKSFTFSLSLFITLLLHKLTIANIETCAGYLNGVSNKLEAAALFELFTGFSNSLDNAHAENAESDAKVMNSIGRDVRERKLVRVYTYSVHTSRT